MNRTRLYWALALIMGIGQTAAAQAPTLDSTFLAGLRWRPIGPANMMGRVSDIAGLPSPSKTFYVASVAGGIFKTTNGGTTFKPLFQTEKVVSMGMLAIAPSDSNTIWAGTGEPNSRNTISPGGGIYKSTDGGEHWKLMGLEKTEHIGRIVVHPTNPNIVYVAALGAAWRANAERGLYKTEDGGATWKLIKFISDKAGFVDVAMDPTNPNVLFAASWERVRGPYFLNSGGPGSALWKTTDGGATWTEVKGGGFPATMKGRIGLAIAPSDHNTVYALVEAAPPPGTVNPKGFLPGTPGNNCPNNGKAGGCGLYRSKDGGNTWEWMNGIDVRPFYYSQVRVDIKNPDRVYWSSTPVQYSNDGGKTVGNATGGIHVDHHAMWMDPNDADHFIVGDDGGVAQTWDKGGTYDFLNVFPIGQFYIVSYDMAIPYRVCGGLQDNGSWCGPSRKASPQNPISNHDWFTFNGGDGFYTAQDPRDPTIIYGESQGGNMARMDLKTGVRTPLRKPSWLDRYRAVEDSIVIERGDTTKPATPQMQKRLQDLRMRQRTDSVALALRWNWNTPFFLSKHNPDVFYAGSNRVMKSTMRGDSLRPISPDLSYADSMKLRVSTQTTGGITLDATGAETYGTIVSLNESPIKAGVLYAGTDDGRVWSSPDDGATWMEHTKAFAKLVPLGTYVTRIEPSHVDVNRWYITFDNHRNGDFAPYVFVTDDGGRTFRSIAATLPHGGVNYVHVIREDPVNANLLYLGSDVGAYVSLDRGANWQRFMTGLPTVPVHDLQVHPRDHELIAATHGRSIWIVDVAPLQQYNAQAIAAADPVLFAPKTALAYQDSPVGGESMGHKSFQASGPPFGGDITYWVSQSDTTRRRASIVILNEKGDTMTTLNGPASRGLQRVYWNLRKRAEPPKPLSPAEKRDSVLMEARIAFVSDSLVKSGMQKAAVDRLITQYRAAQRGDLSAFGFGGGGGGGGGQGGQGQGGQGITTGGGLSSAVGVYAPRPAETTPRVPGATGAAAAGAPGAGGGEGGEGGAGGGQNQLREFQDVLRLPGRAQLRQIGGGGGGGFGGGQPFVDAGTYTVILKIGDKTSTQKITVMRAAGLPTAVNPEEEIVD